MGDLVFLVNRCVMLEIVIDIWGNEICYLKKEVVGECFIYCC